MALHLVSDTFAGPPAESDLAQLETLSGTCFEVARIGNRLRIGPSFVTKQVSTESGDLYVMGLEGNKLKVHYQGACGSCPSSISGTLTGIENLVRQIEPDIEVVAV